MRSVVLFLVLVFLCLNTINAQSENQEKVAMQKAIDAIKKGGLVIVLPTRTKTLNALKATLNNGKLSPKGKKQIADRIASTEATVQRDQEWLIVFFERYYTAGKTYFIFDTHLGELQEGLLDGYFLDEELKVDMTIKRPADFLILRKARPDQAQYTTREALVVYDANGDNLPSLFPSVSPLWGMGLSKESIDYMRHRNAVRKLSTRFNIMLKAHE